MRLLIINSLLRLRLFFIVIVYTACTSAIDINNDGAILTENYLDHNCTSIECINNEDCKVGSRCVEGICFEDECTDGDERNCDIECFLGIQTCQGGI